MRRNNFLLSGFLIILTLAFLYRESILAIVNINEPVPIVSIVFNNNKELKIELYPHYAPNTVNNFLDLAESGFYEYTFISQVVPGYFVKMGDPIGNGFGFPGYHIKSECSFNNFDNGLNLTRGTVAMARGKEFNTEGSQFFILTENAKNLNGQYSAFGRVVDGLELLDEFGTLELNSNYQPKKQIFIKEISIELNGYVKTAPIIYTTD
ncbi:peptidylprolyl isomerase [Candidatus Epulonipiscium viviparus]|uniref:peptidylprolyl isomerase n=1 Tax=Candidatus Epulonipiscium viviparus TaxID=420336 RepID=UPI0027381617|nr:peptidylprolyl isomerase [Candidatus Epulopiscium viviparus]